MDRNSPTKRLSPSPGGATRVRSGSQMEAHGPAADAKATPFSAAFLEKRTREAQTVRCSIDTFLHLCSIDRA